MAESKQMARDVVFHVRRFDPGKNGPDKDSAPYLQAFTVPVQPGMTVLDGLHYIKENLDQTLAWRYSCRMGVCGSCGMLLGGLPRLACNTQILDIAEGELTVAPLPNFAIVRDLAPDLAPLFLKHLAIHPHILRDEPGEKELADPAGEYYQTSAQLEEFLQFTYCIRCACCMAACPTLATDKRYLGPMPLAQAYRYNADTRDGGRKVRSELVGDAEGAARCHYAGECSRVCPKGVDPARAIQLLKRQLVLDYLHLSRRQRPCAKQDAPKDAQRRPNIPEAPPYTVK